MKKPSVKSFDVFTEESNIKALDISNAKEVMLPDGSRYWGQVKNNQFHGKGTITLASGKTYRGYWVYGKMQGKGVYEWPDGRFYKGDFFQNKKHGKGVYSWRNGKTYSGEFVNGLQHGTGEIMFYHRKKLIKRKGQWEKGKRVSWLD